METGDGGLEELQEEFEGGKIQYAFARVVEPISQLPKFILISWCGEGVPVGKKGLFNYHVNDVAHYFKGFHIHINARSEEDVEPALIMQKVKDSSGAKYSIHNEKNRPAPAPSVPNTTSNGPKPFVPISNTYVQHQPSYTSQPIAQKPNPGSKPLYSSPSSSYQPIQTNPKPLSNFTNPSTTTAEAPKPLFSSASSTYEPIKTNPKPLRGIEKFESPKPNVVSSSYQPVKTNPKPLYEQPAARSSGSVTYRTAQFSNPQTVTSSSYQPIKLQPKPLYDEGVASMPYSAPARSSITSPTGNATFNRSSIATPVSPVNRLSESKSPVYSRPSIGSEDKAHRISVQREQEERLAAQREQERLAAQQDQERQTAAMQQQMHDLKLTEDQAKAEAEAMHRREAEERARIDKEVEQKMIADENARNNAQQLNGSTSQSPSAKALYDYSPEEPNEISIYEGEILTSIVQVDEGWWEGVNSKGEKGYFPSNYVELLPVEVAPVVPETQQYSAVPEPVPQVTQAVAANPIAIALYDYDAEESNEITFKTGDTITNINFVSEDWWSGAVNGVEGLFPGSYVELQQ
ncbi:hypothetical protein BC833DRAFT_578565 [Globomyces pollinis-pini]|nr:hypothetical protein BC833DRAFT_578565 [Globomyces pollinis-pini]